MMMMTFIMIRHITHCSNNSGSSIARRCYYGITESSARKLLGLPSIATNTVTADSSRSGELSPKTLRTAYLETAKKCHPDMNTDSKLDFREVTEAYQFLQNTVEGTQTGSHYGISSREELDYRQACSDWLGTTAEIVEECKTDPAFLNWFHKGGSSTRHWANFFAHHGGLAPCLKPAPVELTNESKQGSNYNTVTSATRRRRRK